MRAAIFEGAPVRLCAESRSSDGLSGALDHKRHPSIWSDRFLPGWSGLMIRAPTIEERASLSDSFIGPKPYRATIGNFWRRVAASYRLINSTCSWHRLQLSSRTIRTQPNRREWC